MIWFFLSLAAAMSIAARDVSIKTYTEIEPPEIAVLELAWALPYFLLGSLLVEIPPLDQTFWWSFLISIPINIIAYVLYLYAIKLSPFPYRSPFWLLPLFS